MTTKVIFKKIKFSNLTTKNFNKYILKKGLFVFPAAQGWPLLVNQIDTMSL